MSNTVEQVKELISERDGRFCHREGQELEYKEQFNFSGLADYLRDFAAFANNRGGFLVFGVTDSPRRAAGLSASAIDQLEKLDPEKISGDILETFSCDIPWEYDIIEYRSKRFGYFRIYECPTKPVIAKKDQGRDGEIRNGDIYYRYGGRTQRIQSAELENIINRRIEQTNQHWINLMAKIGRVGPENAAILDTEAGLIEKSPQQVLVIDDELVKKLSFIKEGSFSERDGAKTLKLVGDVVPVDRIEVVKKEKEHLTKIYPLSAVELADEVARRLPSATRNHVWDVIKENKMKTNEDYAALNFRNRKQEDQYRSTGEWSDSTPVIYNDKAVSFIAKVLEGKQAKNGATNGATTNE